MDARNFFNAAGTQPHPPLKRNQSAGDVGGPILAQNHTFLFASYEGLRHHQGLNTASRRLERHRIAPQFRLARIPSRKICWPSYRQANGTLNVHRPSSALPAQREHRSRHHRHQSQLQRCGSHSRLQLDQMTSARNRRRREQFPASATAREGHRQVSRLERDALFSPGTPVNEARVRSKPPFTFSLNPNNLTDPASVGLAGPLGAQPNVPPDHPPFKISD